MTRLRYPNSKWLPPQVSYTDHPQEFFDTLSSKLTREVQEMVGQARLDLLSASTWWHQPCEKVLKVTAKAQRAWQSMHVPVITRGPAVENGWAQLLLGPKDRT